jgi:carboxyl-terminal processing protease
VIGENTFGKGLVQGQFPLSEGAALLLTIAHYYTPSGRLIQRDYQHRSFFDYYYAGRNDGPNLQDVKATDSGRKVYGGGGITPDEKYDPPTANMFQRRVISGFTFYQFASLYFNGKSASLPEGWMPDDALLGRFQTFLNDQHVSFTDAEFNANRQWLKDQISWELHSRSEGKKMADRLALARDPEVLHGIDSLPKAEALFREAQRVIAQRTRR